jgi:thermitase
MKNNSEYSLLPYISENIYGLDSSQAQIIGWEITQFNIQKLWSKTTGKGTKIAVVDTGCDLYHPDIKNNIIPGKNFVSKNKDPIDDNSHGTHCIGSIAAENNVTGMVGIAPECKIVPVKVLDGDGNGKLKNIVDGIIWSADIGVDFISLSLGSPNPASLLENAISYANTKGCIVFCAAGNAGTNHNIMYPARYKNTIAIGSIDKSLQRTSFTCSGDELDFLTPGHDILSCVPGGGYALMSGTSMSTPFAVGCAALVLSYLKTNKKNIPKSYNDYINIFKQMTISLTDTKFKGNKKYEGYGILYPNIDYV